jgi:hypothetical protein
VTQRFSGKNKSKVCWAAFTLHLNRRRSTISEVKRSLKVRETYGTSQFFYETETKFQRLAHHFRGLASQWRGR